MEKNSKIFIAGQSGLVGSAVKRQLENFGYTNLLCPPRSELDLLNQKEVESFFKEFKPEYVFFASGKVGGIYANNTYRAEFIYENLQMTCNIIHQSYLCEVKRLIFFACNCIFPKTCDQPMREEDISTGPLEPTSEAFAMAKIAGIKMCESYNRQYGTDFIPIVPTNVYGQNQNYEPLNSLVIPSLIQRLHQASKDNASEITIWGTGEARRDFIFADDLADAAIFLMKEYPGNEIFNIGTGIEHSIKDLAFTIKELTGFQGKLIFDNDLLGGVDRKLQDLSRIHNLGWRSKIKLEDGLKVSYDNFLKKHSSDTKEKL